MTKEREIGIGLIIKAVIALTCTLFFYMMGIKEIGAFAIAFGIYMVCAFTVLFFPERASFLARILRFIGYSFVVFFAIVCAMPFFQSSCHYYLYAVVYFVLLLPLVVFLAYWLFYEPSLELDSVASPSSECAGHPKD